MFGDLKPYLAVLLYFIQLSDIHQILSFFVALFTLIYLLISIRLKYKELKNK